MSLRQGLPARVTVFEVGPRDGLQNEAGRVPAGAKIAFVNGLARAGLREIEVSSFVSPKWVPQLADAEEVFAGVERVPGVTYSALVPNAKGMARALAAGADKVAVFTAASETFNRRNVNASIAESIERFDPVMEAARAARLPVRGYVSTAFFCPYEGRIAPQDVAGVVQRLLDLGCAEISLGDTIGHATPGDLDPVLDAVQSRVGAERLALHFHDTRGTALANVYHALRRGVVAFDASAGGLGGCPYAPGASGNLATEDLVYLLDGLGIATGVDLDALVAASGAMEDALGRRLPGRVLRAMTASQNEEDQP